jgi:hypothetical protein
LREVGVVIVGVPVDLSGFEVALTRPARRTPSEFPEVGGDDAGADPRVVDVAAFGDQDTLMFTVEVTGAAAGLRPGALVDLVGLVAVLGTGGGQAGVVFRADRIEPAAPRSPATGDGMVGSGWGGSGGVGSPARRAKGDPTPSVTVTFPKDQSVLAAGAAEPGPGRGESHPHASTPPPPCSPARPEVPRDDSDRVPLRVADPVPDRVPGDRGWVR